jgi:DNA repair protein RadC
VFPSDEDNEVTARLADAAEILGIQLLDHVILGRKGFYSYSKEKNILNR